MAKEATNPKPSKQVEQYCLAGHKNTRESTFEYTEAEKQTTEKVRFRYLLSFFSYKPLDWRSYSSYIELLHAQNDITCIIVAPFSLSVNWQEWRF